MHFPKQVSQRRRLIASSCSAFVLTSMLGMAQAATLIVTNGQDTGGAGSLRQTLLNANAGDTIVFADGVSTITLTKQLELTKNVSIDGGTSGVTLDGQLKGRVVLVNAGVNATLSRLTITRGLLAGKGIGAEDSVASGSSLGAGIRNDGNLTLDNVQVLGNYATGGGGGDTSMDTGKSAGGGGSGVRVSLGNGQWLTGSGGTGGFGATGSAGGTGGTEGGGAKNYGPSGTRAGSGINGGGGGGAADSGRGGAGGGGGGWAGGGGGGGGGTTGVTSGGGGGGGYGGGGGRINPSGVNQLGTGGTGPGGVGNASGGTPNGGSASAGVNGVQGRDTNGGGGGGYATLNGVWVGGGGGSSGNSGTTGGAAVGGIYNAAGALLDVRGNACSVSGNLAAGGGGSGTYNGGEAVGGLRNAGTLNITETCRAAISGNAADGGGFGGENRAPGRSDNNMNGDWTLAVAASANGSVSAGSTPAPKANGINACTSATCQAAYTLNDVVTLTAAPASGFHVKWGGACTASDTNPLQAKVTMTDNAACTVSFANTYALNIAATDNGSIECRASGNIVSNGALIPSNTAVSCTATAVANYRQGSWANSCSSATVGESCNIIMDGDKTVGARFVRTAGGTEIPGGGNVTLETSGSTCVLTSGPTYSAAPSSGAPAGFSFPYGQIAFSATGCVPGSVLALSVTLPKALPAGTRMYKWLDGQWVEWKQANIKGTSVQFAVKDNDGTSTATLTGDTNREGGSIDDPFLLAAPLPVAAPVPTLSHWALLVLSVLAAGLGMGAQWRRRNV